MGLRVALGCSLTRSAIIATVLAVLGGACGCRSARARSGSALAFGLRRVPRRAA